MTNTTMSVSPNGATMALASPRGGYVTLSDLASNKVTDQFGPLKLDTWVAHPLLAFSPDGTVVAYSSGLAYTSTLVTSKSQGDLVATRVRLRDLLTKGEWELKESGWRPPRRSTK